jgi:DegV family protein with EDD domain
VEGEPVTFSGDIEQFDAKTYYDQLRAGMDIKTSLLNAQLFMDHFRPCLEQGLDVLYVGLSSGVSGTYQASCMAAEELMEEFPGRTVRTVDSRGASLGVGILTCRGADHRAEGMDVNAAADALVEESDHLCQYFTVDDLNFLKRTGRVSGATAAIGTVLNIKPLLYGDEEGHIVARAKVRGRKKAIEAILDLYAKKAVNAENGRVAITHGDCLEEAQLLADRVCQIAKPKDLIICPHEPFTGVHVGPGMLALYFFGDCR